MEVDKGVSESFSDKGLLRYVDLAELKKLIVALRRTPRRGNFVDTQLSDVYATMSDRTMTKEDTMVTFADRVFKNFDDKQWDGYMSEGELKGTVPGDGNTYGHTKLQRGIAKQYMKHDLDGGLLSADDIELLDLAFLIHDVGEALRGDVSFPDKNLSSEQFEKQCGEYLFKKILKPAYRDPQCPEYKRLQEAYDINFNASHRLNPIFKLYEKYSYINGSMIAAKHPKKIADAFGLVQEVLGNTLPAVMEEKSQFPSAEAFLKENMPAINDMFVFVERNLFAKESAQEKLKKENPNREPTHAEQLRQEKEKQWNLKYQHSKNVRFSGIVNDFYHEQHLENGLKETSLIDDNLFQVQYPKEIGKMAFLERFALHVLSSFTEVIPITEPYREFESQKLENGELVLLPSEREKHKQLLQFEQQMKEVMSMLKDRSVMFVFDHPTFANIPIWIGQLFYYAKLFDMEYVLDNIYTIVGPALMTQSHRKIILALSQILKTIPNTGNAKFPIPKRIIAQIIQKFRDILVDKGSKAGNIFLMAFAGKRDINFWEPNGEISSINFGDDAYDNIPSSLKLIEDFSNQGGLVVMVGTNETDMKAGLPEKGNDREAGNTYVSMKVLEQDEVYALVTTGTFTPTLASLVKNRYGLSVGHAVGDEQLKILAKQKSESSLSVRDSAFVPGIDFKDTYAKKVTRKIFNLLKDHSEWTVRSQASRMLKQKSK